MPDQRKVRPVAVPGPDGRTLTLNDLPSADTRYWSMRRKAQVAAAVDGGLLSVTEACERYCMTFEELQVWRIRLRRDGTRGLRITETSRYRKREAEEEEG